MLTTHVYSRVLNEVEGVSSETAPKLRLSVQYKNTGELIRLKEPWIAEIGHAHRRQMFSFVCRAALPSIL